MEYTREAKVTIYKDSNKSTTEVTIELREYDDDETMDDFLDRVNDKMREIYLNE